MNCYYDCRDEIKSLGLSIDRANKIMSIIGKYFTSNDSVADKVNKQVELRSKIYNQKVEEAQKIIDNPQLVVAEMIGEVICEHLSFDSESEMYSGNYAKLKWDNKELGSVCLESYSDD